MLLTFANAFWAAGNVGMYVAWHDPWNLGVGILCGFVAFFSALREV